MIELTIFKGEFSFCNTCLPEEETDALEAELKHIATKNLRSRKLMNQKIRQILFLLLITFTLFSLWAGFALLIINKFFYKDLTGYTIGRICIWDFIALIISILMAKLMLRKWGNIKVLEIDNNQLLTMHPNYGKYFVIYFLIAIIVGIWQFWLFSLKF